MRTLLYVIVYVAIFNASVDAQTAPTAQPKIPSSQDNAGRHASGGIATSAEAEALRADLLKMRSLISQMQMNLPFVASTENPLKHQFELELEMWGILINSMQQRLDAMGATPSATRGASESERGPSSASKDTRFQPLLENEHIHAFRLELPARATAPVYQNVHDVVWIAVTNSDMTLVDRQRRETVVRFRAGDVRLLRRNRVTSMRNSGRASLLGVLVELKRPVLASAECNCATGIEQAVCGCGRNQHLPGLWAYSLGELTLAGTTLNAAQSFQAPARRGDTLLIAISPLELLDRATQGSLRVAAGDVRWMRAGIHRLSNEGTAPARFITLEF
jgi:hypothetical protein